jgi:hypothetical protein
MNQAHAHMFVGRTEEARKEYLAHRGETDAQGRPWETGVVRDFRLFREQGREHSLLAEIEQLSKSALPVEAGK